MSASLRERRRRLLRDEIVGAAQQLLGERGYAALSMDELAQRVGVSKPTLYAHFPTREDLIATMIGALIEQLFSETDAPPTARSSPLEQLSALLRRAIQVQFAARAAAYQIWLPEAAELLHRHPASQHALEQAQQKVIALCRSAIERGEVTVTDNAEHVARLFSALVCLPFAGGLPVSSEAEVEQLTEFAVRMLQRQLVAR